MPSSIICTLLQECLMLKFMFVFIQVNFIQETKFFNATPSLHVHVTILIQFVCYFHIGCKTILQFWVFITHVIIPKYLFFISTIIARILLCTIYAFVSFHHHPFPHYQQKYSMAMFLYMVTWEIFFFRMALALVA